MCACVCASMQCTRVCGVLDRGGSRVFASSSTDDHVSDWLQYLSPTGFCEPLLPPYRNQTSLKNAVITTCGFRNKHLKLGLTHILNVSCFCYNVTFTLWENQPHYQGLGTARLHLPLVHYKPPFFMAPSSLHTFQKHCSFSQILKKTFLSHHLSFSYSYARILAQGSLEHFWCCQE